MLHTASDLSIFIRDNRFLDGAENKSEIPTNALYIYTILLNRPLHKELFKSIYAISDVLICADGGANRLYDALQQEDPADYLPNTIIGDFDSIRKEVMEYYKSKGVTLLYNKSQSNTDLEKCVYYTFENSENLKNLSKIKTAPVSQIASHSLAAPIKVIALGAFGGRMDQTMNSLHVLLKMYKNFEEKAQEAEIMMMDENSLVLFLEPGMHEIYPSAKFESEDGCGIVPVSQCQYIETEGLKYNMGNKYEFCELEFGQFMSTSNSIIDSKVVIRNSHACFWITTLNIHYESTPGHSEGEDSDNDEKKEKLHIPELKK